MAHTSFSRLVSWDVPTDVAMPVLQLCAGNLQRACDPKGPCNYNSIYLGPKGFPYNYSMAQVYIMWVHGPFGQRCRFMG